MYYSDLTKLAESAETKYKIAKEEPVKYLVRAAVAGFYIVVAIILSYTAGALLYDDYHGVAKLAVAACFSTAILLIYFLGGELFTGNNVIMSVGAFEKRVTWSNVLKVWLLSYIGNIIGTFILSLIFTKSGASIDVLQPYLEPLVDKKLHTPALQLVLKGVMCNFMVCITSVINVRLKSESGKMILMFWVIAAFILAGFEHSVANMGIFSISYFIFGGLPMDLVLRNMFFVTIGNIIGGGFLLGGSMKLMSVKDSTH